MQLPSYSEWSAETSKPPVLQAKVSRGLPPLTLRGVLPLPTGPTCRSHRCSSTQTLALMSAHTGWAPACSSRHVSTQHAVCRGVWTGSADTAGVCVQHPAASHSMNVAVCRDQADVTELLSKIRGEESVQQLTAVLRACLLPALQMPRCRCQPT